LLFLAPAVAPVLPLEPCCRCRDRNCCPPHKASDEPQAAWVFCSRSSEGGL